MLRMFEHGTATNDLLGAHKKIGIDTTVSILCGICVSLFVFYWSLIRCRSRSHTSNSYIKCISILWNVWIYKLMGLLRAINHFRVITFIASSSSSHGTIFLGPNSSILCKNLPQFSTQELIAGSGAVENQRYIKVCCLVYTFGKFIFQLFGHRFCRRKRTKWKPYKFPPTNLCLPLISR